jgi:hypothetical protein
VKLENIPRSVLFSGYDTCLFLLCISPLGSYVCYLKSVKSENIPRSGIFSGYGHDARLYLVFYCWFLCIVTMSDVKLQLGSSVLLSCLVSS